MQFRFLLPMCAEMPRHKAQEVLRYLTAYSIAQADPKNPDTQTAIRGLEDAAAGRDSAEADEPPMTLDQIKASMSVLGFEEVD